MTRESDSGDRRLAAVLFSDMKGYSRQMGDDEHGTLSRLAVHNRIFREAIARHGGREVKTVGDAFMVEFGSAVQAVRCALAVLTALEVHNAATHDEPIEVRMGVHVGDVIAVDGDLFGETVNVAARLEPQAPVGSVCVSPAVLQQVRKRVEASGTALGARRLKNIANPVELYALVPAPDLLEQVAPASSRPSVTMGAVAVLGASAVALGAVWWWGTNPAPDPPPPRSATTLRIATSNPFGPALTRPEVIDGTEVLRWLTLEPLVRISRDGTMGSTVVHIDQTTDGQRLVLTPMTGTAFPASPCTGDGRAADAADIAASVNLCRLGLDVQVADSTAVIDLGGPHPYPLSELEHCPLIPAGIEECRDASGGALLVGTGPFVMTNGIQGGPVTLSARPDADVGADRVVVIPHASTALATTSVTSGAADLLVTGAPEEVTEHTGDFATFTFENTGSSLLVVEFSPKAAAPWSDRTVRRALALSIDRKAAAALLPSRGRPLGRLLWEGTSGRDPTVEPLDHNPDQARALLDGRRPVLRLGVSDERQQIAHQLKRQGESTGIEVKVVADVLPNLVTAWSEGQLDAILWIHFAAQVGTDPFPTVVDSALPEEVRALRAASRPEDRHRLYRAWEARQLAQLDLIPVAQIPDVLAVVLNRKAFEVVPDPRPAHESTRGIVDGRWLAGLTPIAP